MILFLNQGCHSEIVNAIIWHWIGDPSLEGSYFMEPFIVWDNYLNCFNAGMCPVCFPYHHINTPHHGGLRVCILNDITMQE